MEKVTKETIAHIAKLARLGLDEETSIQYAEQCGRILNFFEQLGEVDTTKVEPMAHAGSKGTAWREDKVIPSGQAKSILDNAPDRDADFFQVPTVIT